MSCRQTLCPLPLLYSLLPVLTTLTSHWGSPDMSAQSSVPARFDGQDKDLLDAEASIDPLVNNAPPTPSGMDIN